MDNKIIIGIVVVILVAGGILLLTLGGGGVRGEEPIKIAALLWLSNPGGEGPSDEGIKSFHNGLLLSVDELNSQGGINNRPVELLIYDTKGDPEIAGNLFEEVEEEHNPLLYIVVIDSVSLALEELAKEHEVVLFSGTSALTSDWTYGYYPPVNKEIEPLFSVLKEQSIEKLGVLYVDHEFGRTLFGTIEKEFSELGKQVKGEVYPPGTTDFREYISGLLEFDAIEIVSFRPETPIIIQDLRRANYSGIIFVSSNNIAPEFFAVQSMQGVYGPSTAVYNPNFVFVQRVKEEYEERYVREFDFVGGLGYDVIFLLGELLEGEEISREGVKDILDQGFILGGILGNINVLAGSHDISPNLNAVQIVDGKLEYL